MKNKYDIAIGIPSYNEQATISNVTKQIDIGLSNYFPQLDAIIVNVDNDSTDETKHRFLSTETKNPKEYISTPKGLKGKGYNIQNFFSFVNNYGVIAAAIFDADLESISPEWINQMLSPVLSLNYDFVYPSYFRHRYDGTITNQICYPLVVGIFGIDIPKANA